MSKTSSGDVGSGLGGKNSTGLPPFTLPNTLTGGLPIGSGVDEYVNLPIGPATDVLTSNGTTAYWAPSTGGSGGTAVNFTATGGLVPSATSGVATKVINWTAGVDTQTGFTPGTATYTVQLAGLYLINASVTFTTTYGLYDCQCMIYVNGSQAWVGEFSHSPVNALGTCSISWTHTFAVNDTVNIYCLQNSGVSLSIAPQPYCTWTMASLGGASGGGGGGGTSSIFSAKNGSCTAPNSDDTIVSGWTVVSDTAGAWNAGGSHYVIPNTGTYLITSSLTFESSFVSYEAQSYIYINGALGWEGEFSHAPITSLGTTTVTWATTLTAGTQVSAWCFQNSGGTLHILSQPFTTFTIASLSV